jgi:hypothetical protein
MEQIVSDARSASQNAWDSGDLVISFSCGCSGFERCFEISWQQLKIVDGVASLNTRILPNRSDMLIFWSATVYSGRKTNLRFNHYTHGNIVTQDLSLSRGLSKW